MGLPSFIGFVVALLWIGSYIGRSRERARAEVPMDVATNEMLIKALRQVAREDFAGACATLKQHVGNYPEATGPYLALGTLYRWIGETDRSLRIHQNIVVSPLANEEEKLEALIELGFDYAKLGKEERSAEIFLEVDEKKQKGIEVDRHLARLFMKLERWEKAFIHLHRAMKRAKKWDNRQLALVQIMAGKQALAKGHHKKALDHFQNAVSYDERQAGGHVGAAEAYVALRKPKRGLPPATKAFQEFPSEVPRTEPALYRVHDALNDHAAHEQMLVAFTIDHPENGEAFLALARRLSEQGRNQEALKAVERAVELAPENVDVRREHLRHLLRISPEDAYRQAYELYLASQMPSPDPDKIRLMQLSEGVEEEKLETVAS